MNSPLHGLRILNTRPGQQGLALEEAITNAGGISIHFPVFSIEPTDAAWMQRLPDLSLVHKAVFISTNAVEICFKTLKQPWPEAIDVFAIGKATGKALQDYGITAVHIPEQADSVHLLSLPGLQQVDGETILLLKGEGGLTLIENTLQARSARLFILELYKRTVIKHNPAFVNSIWQNDSVDIILITSEEILNNIFTLFPDTWLCKKPCLLVSERLVNSAIHRGMEHIFTSAPDAILETLITYSRTVHD